MICDAEPGDVDPQQCPLLLSNAIKTGAQYLYGVFPPIFSIKAKTMKVNNKHVINISLNFPFLQHFLDLNERLAHF